jgi:hypothetical protein
MGIVPSILELWFNQRIEFQNLAKKYGKEGNKEQEAYYTRRQHCQKIFLNSVYGILGLSSSRLYNKDNAESTTISGQTIIKSSEKIVIEHFKKIYAKYGKTIEDTRNIVQYIDTDSVAGDSIINTNLYGRCKIEDAFNKLKNDRDVLNITDISGRDFVFPEKLTLPYYDEHSKTVKNGKVEYVEKHMVKKKMYKLKTKTKKEIIVTEDHSIMVLRDDFLIQVYPKDILKTDKIIELS